MLSTVQNLSPGFDTTPEANAEGELLGIAEDDNGTRVYCFDFDGVHAGYGGDLPGEDQGASDDGKITWNALRRFHRGCERTDAKSPHR